MEKKANVLGTQYCEMLSQILQKQRNQYIVGGTVAIFILYKYSNLISNFLSKNTLLATSINIVSNVDQSKIITVASSIGVASFLVYNQIYMKEITPNDIIYFWFGNIIDKNADIHKPLLMKWMKPDPSFDNEIRYRFGKFMRDVLVNEKKYYENHPKWGNDLDGAGLCAMIIICDQFTRNVYRGTKEAFKYDEYAQKLSFKALNNGYFEKLREIHPLYAWIMMWGFGHSENIQHLKIAKQIYGDLLTFMGVKHPMYKMCKMDYEKGPFFKHYDMIEKYGRYLQRDEIFERETSKEEDEYLNESGFKMLIKYNHPRWNDVSF